MLRIGVDARLLSESITGIGRYTAELTRHLTSYPAKFCLYSSGSFIGESWQQRNVLLRSANLRGRVAKMLWSQSFLPYWASRDDVDLFWGATHRLPRYLPSKTARVVTIHDLVWKHAGETMRPLSLWMEKKLMPEAIALSDRIVADSNSTAKSIVAEYPEVSDKVRIVYPGVTELPLPRSFQSLSVLGVDQPYFLFVGTLEPRKNLRRLMEAYALLDSNIKSCAKLVVAGGKGWGNIDIVNLVKEFGLESKVVITGYVNDEQLSTLYAHSLFLAMPSLYEGFGLPLVEAMSYSKPVLASNCSSLPEVAGSAGVIIDPLDVISIKMGLESLLGNKYYRESLACQALANASRFTWSGAAQQMWSVFDEALTVRARLHRGG